MPSVAGRQAARRNAAGQSSRRSMATCRAAPRRISADVRHCRGLELDHLAGRSRRRRCRPARQPVMARVPDPGQDDRLRCRRGRSRKKFVEELVRTASRWSFNVALTRLSSTARFSVGQLVKKSIPPLAPARRERSSMSGFGSLLPAPRRATIVAVARRWTRRPSYPRRSGSSGLQGPLTYRISRSGPSPLVERRQAVARTALDAVATHPPPWSESRRRPRCGRRSSQLVIPIEAVFAHFSATLCIRS